MTTLVRAEVLKLRHTRSLLALPLVGVLVSAIGTIVVLTAGTATDIPEGLSAYGPLRFGPTNAGLLLLLFGIRLMADETQHHTLAATFVRTPDRRRVLAGKAIVAATTAVAFTVAVYLVVIPLTLIGLEVRGLDMSHDVGATVALLGRVTVAMVLLAVLGVTVGATIGNRTVALVAAVTWFALAEDIVGGLLHLEEVLPGAAVQGLVTAGGEGASGAPSSALVLAAYVLAGAVAASTSIRRDLT